MSQDRNTRDKPTHGHQISSKGRKNIQGRKSASISGIGKSVQLHTHTHTHTQRTFSNLFTKCKTDQIPKCRPDTIKTLRGKHRHKKLWHKLQQDAFQFTSQSNENKNKINNYNHENKR